MRGSGLQPLRYLGLLLGLLCMLAGCGNNGGSSTTGNTASRSRQLSLQLQLSSEAVSAAPPAGFPAAQARQVQPGDPAFLERLEIRLQVQDSDFVSPQVFLLDPAQQETATLDVAVPDTAPTTFEVLVSAFTSQGIEAYRGQTTVARGQTSAVVQLPRFAFVPVPATAANLQQTTFNFTDGAVFGLANMPVTLATGTFAGDVGDFALTGSGSVASGSVTIGSCTFVVTMSSFPPGQDLQVGDQIVIDPCQVDAIDRRLIATNMSVSVTPTISSTPVLIPPGTTLNLPPPLTLTIAEDTSGTVQVVASVSGTRPGTTTLGITIPPTQGTASLTSAGLVTYQPTGNFNGSDSLMVTVIATFTDNNSPPLLLGTVPISVIVQPVGDAPVPTGPSINTSLNTPSTIQISVNDPDAGQLQTFSISTSPAHGTASVTASGVVTYTPAPGFSGLDSFGVTVTDNGTPPLSGTVTIPVTVQASPNRAPVPTAPGISTPQNMPGTSTVSPNDPDAGQLQTFSISTPPAHGTASVTASGVVTYTPASGFSGADSFGVTVTDNGTPPLSGTVTIPVTVQAPPNRAPVPTAPGISTPQNMPGTSTVSPNDPDAGQLQTFSISTPPAHGTASVTASGVATYTPASGFSGADSFGVTVTDNGTPPLSGTVTIPVTVQAPPNRAPVPTAPGISTPQNMPGTSTVSPNDPDAGQLQTFSISTPPAHGTASVTASGVATYTPASGFSGADSFGVTVTDNGTPPLSGTVTIPVTVQAPPNRAPVPTAPGISTPQNMPGTSTVSPNDPDAGQLQTFSISTPPAHGTASVTASGVVTYTPASGFSGADSFGVTVTDNGTPPLLGTVTIPVTVQAPPNQAPVPTAPGISTPQNMPGTSTVSPNDPDAGQLQTFSISTPPAHGTANVTASGVATYTPASGFSGADSFGVTVTDNGTPPLSGTVTIPVNVLPNRPPVLANPGAQSNTEGDVVGLQLNASDPDGNVLTFSGSSLPLGLNINAATGLVSGTIASDAASSVPLNVTVTVTDNGQPPLSTSVSFPWNIAASIPVNTVRLVAPAGPVSPGTTFPATVQINTGTTNVVSYFFDLIFDPRVVTVTNITQGSPLFEVPVTNLGTSAVGSGTVKFAANNPTFAPANGVLTLATITFQVVGSPGLSSLLTLQLPANPANGVLVNDAFQAIGGITFVNDAVTVN